MISMERKKFISDLVDKFGEVYVANKEGISIETVRDYVFRYKSDLEEENKSLKKERETWVESSTIATGTTITAIKPDTLMDATKLFKVDMDIWEAERMTINSYDMPAKDGVVRTMYQVKVAFKKRKETLTPKELADIFLKEIRGYNPIEFPDRPMPSQDGGLVEINIADLHLGKLAWGKEAGQSFDITIAKHRFYKLLADMIDRIAPYPYEKIIFVVGNDFFQADNANDTTTYGTKVETDVRWQKRIAIGHSMLVTAVELLRNYASVHVKVILGNHDEATMFSAGEYIKAWFKNDKGVEVDNSPAPRKYFHWEDLLLGYAHGHKEKPVDYFALMATEQAKAWSKINFKEFHVAHRHHESSKDYNGLVVRWVKGATGTDSWHSEKGFVGAVQGAEAFVYEKGLGLVAHLHSNIKGR